MMTHIEVRLFEVDVSEDLRLDTKAGLAIAVRMIPMRYRRGATKYRIRGVSRPINGRKHVFIAAEFT